MTAYHVRFRVTPDDVDRLVIVDLNGLFELLQLLERCGSTNVRVSGATPRTAADARRSL